MRPIYIIIFSILIATSCSRGYYNVAQTYYDYDEAYALAQSLHRGTLIVQIPCTKKKTKILYSLYQNETNQEKKAKLKEEYDQQKIRLSITQESIVRAVTEYYDFSNYAFIPDTLIRKFKNGERGNIFLKSDFTLGENVEIDDSKLIMYLRYVRDFDDLRIHKEDGTFPPDPFPFASTLPTGDMDAVEIDDLPNSIWDTSIFHAIDIIDNRLKKFVAASKPPSSE